MLSLNDTYLIIDALINYYLFHEVVIFVLTLKVQ